MTKHDCVFPQTFLFYFESNKQISHISTQNEMCRRFLFVQMIHASSVWVTTLKFKQKILLNNNERNSFS